MLDMTWQPSLLGAADGPDGPSFDASFCSAVTTVLADDAWVEHVPGWCRGHDDLFESVVASGEWSQRTMEMYGERVAQPRLSTTWGTRDLPARLSVLHDAVELLRDRYRCLPDRVTANLYRAGRDSVAWHGDRVLRERDRSIVAVLTLGTARPFLLRPKGGGPSLRFVPQPGDLVVMGGTCQRTWQHAVPKVARSGPRACVMFRHDPDAPPPDSRAPAPSGTVGGTAVRGL